MPAHSPITYHTCSRALSLLMLTFPLIINTASSLIDHSAENIEIRYNPEHDDAETLITLGQRLPLKHVDMYALELIPGISDTLAENILKRRAAVSAVAGYLRPGQKHRAFEVVHSIGAKTAEKLLHYLDPLGEPNSSLDPSP